MFDKTKNRLKWEKVCMDNTVPYTFKNAIRSMFIPYNIDFDIFGINAECIENCCERNSTGRLASKSVLETVRDLNYKFSCIRCSSMPLWYYMAFPDVFIWTISDSPQLKQFMKEFESKVGSSNIIDDSGDVGIPYVKEFVDAYLRSTGNKLECAIR